MLIPAKRYLDPETVPAFLRDVPELEEHAVYRSDNEKIIHVQMRVGGGLMMFGPPNDGPFDRYRADPTEIGGRETTTIYAVVPDVAGRHARARAAGADILLPLSDQDHGGQAVTMAEREGQVWTFGDGDPEAAG